jgi:hypothetical protein
MVREYEIKELLPPNPSIHNEIVGLFRNQESNELLGALATAIERSELAHKINLARLTEIKGHRVKINLNISHIPRLLVRLADVNIVFRSTGDLVKYQKLLPSAKPFLLSKISGQRANVSGQSIILKKALGPFRLHLYNVLYTAPAAIQALLSQRDIKSEGYDTIMGQGPRLTHHIGFKADEIRFVASQVKHNLGVAHVIEGYRSSGLSGISDPFGGFLGRAQK